MHMQGEEMHMRGSWTVQALAPPTINDLRLRLRLAWPAGLPLTETHVFTASRAVCTDRSIGRHRQRRPGLPAERKKRSCPAKQVLDRIYACMASSYSPGIKIVGGRNPLLDAMIGRHEAHQAGTSTSCLDGLHCPHVVASPVNMSCMHAASSIVSMHETS